MAYAILNTHSNTLFVKGDSDDIEYYDTAEDAADELEFIAREDPEWADSHIVIQIINGAL